MGSCVATHFRMATHFRAWACGALSLACAGRCLLCGQRTDMGDRERMSMRKAKRSLTLPAGGIHRGELAPVCCAQWKVTRRLRGEGARAAGRRASADQRFAVGNSDTVVFDPSSAVVMAVPIDLAKQA
jgi:hypothetical protein